MSKVQKRLALEYTPADYRQGVYLGKFIETDDINVGDSILVHHKCRYSGRRLLKKVVRKELAYTFVNGSHEQKIYDYIVKGGSAYKSNLKLVSFYDDLIDTTDAPEYLNAFGKVSF